MSSLKFNWPMADLYPAFCTLHPDFKIEVLSETDSTNTQLLARLHQGDTTPTLLVAENQTAGKGRMGKSWHAQPGQALTFSLLIPTTLENVGWLALVTACAFIRTLEKKLPAHPSSLIKIKWPNDIWLKPSPTATWHKLVGILIETATVNQQRYAVIGIGINLSSSALDETFQTPRGTLQQIGTNWDVPTAFSQLAPELTQAVYNFKKEDIPYWKALFGQYDLLFNQRLRTSSGIEGIGMGVSAQGQLLIKTQNDIQTIHSGEVSIRPCSDI
ncbi:MAG: biotin--[acetyl-CoA-carboxylase] ligase [Saezia sp.]